MMTKLKIWGCTLGVIIAAGAYLSYHWYSSSGRSWLSACEVEIKQRLKSPSSYKRIDAMLVSEKVDTDDWLKNLRQKHEQGEGVTSLTLEQYEANPPKITDWKWLIDYEASNSFGAMIRGSSTCEARMMRGNSPPHNIDPAFVKVDGMDRHAWLMSKVRNSINADP